MPNRWALRAAAAAVLVLALVAAGRWAMARGWLSPEALQRGLDPLGPWALPAFVLLFAVATVLAVPGSVLAVAGALAFGLWGGFAANVAGATLGACGAFLAARRLGREPLARWLDGRERLRDLDAALAGRGAVAVLLLRLLPVLPFNVLNYACGLTGIGFVPYTAATVVGIAPAAFAYCYATVALADPGSSWSSPRSLAALALLALLLVALPLLVRHLTRSTTVLDRLAGSRPAGEVRPVDRPGEPENQQDDGDAADEGAPPAEPPAAFQPDP